MFFVWLKRDFEFFTRHFSTLCLSPAADAFSAAQVLLYTMFHIYYCFTSGETATVVLFYTSIGNCSGFAALSKATRLHWQKQSFHLVKHKSCCSDSVRLFVLLCNFGESKHFKHLSLIMTQKTKILKQNDIFFCSMRSYYSFCKWSLVLLSAI